MLNNLIRLFYFYFWFAIFILIRVEAILSILLGMAIAIFMLRVVIIVIVVIRISEVRLLLLPRELLQLSLFSSVPYAVIEEFLLFFFLFQYLLLLLHLCLLYVILALEIVVNKKRLDVILVNQFEALFALRVKPLILIQILCYDSLPNKCIPDHVDAQRAALKVSSLHHMVHFFGEKPQ